MFSGVSSESKERIAGSSGYGWYGMPRRAGKGGAGGACAGALLHYLKESDHTKPPDRSWLTTMVGMQKWLSKEGYTTVPCLSAGNNNFDFKRPFQHPQPSVREQPEAERQDQELFLSAATILARSQPSTARGRTCPR